MKKLKVLLGAAALLASSGAMAGQFGIGLCEYSMSGRTGDVLWGVKDAPTMSDDTYKQMVKYCSSDENINKARAALSKMPEFPADQPASIPAEGVNLDEADDTYNACVLGAVNDGKGFLRLVSKYNGNLRMMNILRKSHSYGYNVASNYRDCTNYLMGR